MSAYAPFRLLIAVAAALLMATVIASSSAHALLLGEAVVRSAPGAPLRVVIPVQPSPGEPLEAACFRIVPAPDSAPPVVTAKVSLERAAATPRLIVTTQNAVADPAVRFAIEAGCGSTLRRNYALLLDPRGVSAARTTTIATTNSAREPGQEPLETTPIAADHAAGKASLGPKLAAQLANDEPASPGVTRGREPSVSALRAARAPAASLPPASLPEPERHGAVAADDSGHLGWYLGAPLGMGAIALGVLFVTRRRVSPEMPDWTRGGEHTGPRSRTDMSAQPVTLSQGNPTPMPKLATRQRPDGASLRVRESGIAANSLRRKPSPDLSTLDTLINDVSEADRREERAVREAWAAARSAVESEEGNAILRAIDEAERELLFVPPLPPEAAMNRSLEDDLLSQPRRPDKAAA